jgi:hypothetical protein
MEKQYIEHGSIIIQPQDTNWGKLHWPTLCSHKIKNLVYVTLASASSLFLTGRRASAAEALSSAGIFFLFFSFRAWREPWAPFGRS